MFGVPLVALVLGLRSPLDCHRLPAGPEFKLGHYPIRQKGLASLMPDKGWQRHFDEPIPLPKGKKLVTLRDAAEYIAKLPKAEHDAEEWLTAMEALLLVAEHDGPTRFARIGMMRALYRHVERVFKPSRKAKHWGRRKLARER